MNILVILSLASIVLYFLKIRSFHFNWKRYKEFNVSASTSLVAVSVVIAFRNEKSRLPRLLTALQKQNYPERFEVVLVDDHSDDGSDVIVKQFCKQFFNFRYIGCDDNRKGKKDAIGAGIKAASHELIITTDADCSMHESWISTIAEFYAKNQPDLIIGLIDVDSGSTFFERFQEVEFLSLVASGAGAAAYGKPIYCNAANFAFKKNLVEYSADPFRNITASGDDTFLLHNAKKQKKRILLLKSHDAVIKTTLPETWSAYLNQRSRWISKSRYYYDLDTIFTAMMVLFVNLLFIAAFAVFIFGNVIWLFPVMYIIKVSADYALLSEFMHFFDKKLPLLRFMLYSVLYPFAVIIFVFAGFFLSYRWKGRRFSAK
jgi:poly-beta-1,6-N-acetyl-D-glucosamine synthase